MPYTVFRVPLAFTRGSALRNTEYGTRITEHGIPNTEYDSPLPRASFTLSMARPREMVGINSYMLHTVCILVKLPSVIGRYRASVHQSVTRHDKYQKKPIPGIRRYK